MFCNGFKMWMYIYLIVSLLITASFALEEPWEFSPRYNKVYKKEHVREWSCGRLFYRTFQPDVRRDVLYVGAMDKIFRLNLSNINRTRCEGDAITIDPSNIPNCVSKGKSEHYDCRNHIRVIQPIGDGNRLYICGTNAHNPMDYVIHANLSHVSPSERHPGIGDGIAKCPFDPEDNATAVWVEKGNPGDLPGLYSGTVAEFTKADTVIFRTNLYDPKTGNDIHPFKRTIKYDSKWLDKPQFVGSYAVGEHVLFFFRESAVEYINCGKSVYSRVARVCKRDTGGKNILSKNWASFLKARLNCSIPGEFPFYFNEIQDIYKHPDDDSTFYGVFTTSTSGLTGSAVCTFSLSSIEDAFAGKFKEQATSSSAWLPVLGSKVPEPRPGLCVNDTRTLPDSVLNFIRGHPLMDAAVAPRSPKPVFFRRDVRLTRLAAHPFDVDGVHYTVYYVADEQGHITKLAEWRSGDGEFKSRLIDVFEATTPHPVRAMHISQKHQSLYVSWDGGVRQLPLVVCGSRHAECASCVKDPYCGWDRDRSQCRPHVTGLLQDVTNATPGICDSSIRVRSIRAYWGAAVHLGCEGGGRWVRPGGGVAHHLVTVDGGLVILSATERDTGRYECRRGADTLRAYNLTLDTKTCSAPSESEYRKVYSDWCHEFEKYKLAMKSWHSKQQKCQHPNEVTR